LSFDRLRSLLKKMLSFLIEQSAERDLKRIKRHSPKIFSEIVSKIYSLKDNPFPSNARKIIGLDKAFRIRIGDWRVIYEVDNQQKVIRIFRVRHRREAYR